MTEPLMVLYAVRNRDGHYFRAKGYGGYGDTWVPDLKKARIYPRPGPARAQVTFFANHHPKYGIPELVELRVTEVVAIQETERIRKVQTRKAKQEAESAKRHAQWEKDQAQKKLSEAKETLARLKKAEEDAERRRQERKT